MLSSHLVKLTFKVGDSPFKTLYKDIRFEIIPKTASETLSDAIGSLWVVRMLKSDD